MVNLFNNFNRWFQRKRDQLNKTAAGNISYPASSAAVVFGGHLSARAAFRLEPPFAAR